MPQGVLWQQSRTNKNNLAMAALACLLPKEGEDSDRAKTKATGTPVFRPLNPGESLSLACVLVYSLFLLQPEEHFLGKFRRR